MSFDDMDFSWVHTIKDQVVNNLWGDDDKSLRTVCLSALESVNEFKPQLTRTIKKWRQLTRKLLAKAKEEERELLSLFSKKIEVTND